MMIKKLKSLLLTLCLILSFSNQAMAQEGGDNDFLNNSYLDVTTVLLATAGGAILGLSTLSFVEEPGDHLKNIVVGGAIGLIVGVGVVAWSQATESKDYYETNAYLDAKEFDTKSRINWSQKEINKRSNFVSSTAPQFNYSFKF